MAFQSQFKTAPKMCRNGTRENCPVNKCRFQHSMPAHVIYSSALKGAVPPPPSPVTSPTRSHFPSTAQGIRGWCDDGKVHAQHICPSVENAVLTQGPRDLNGTPPGPFDANALAQATDGLAIYRAWLESQVEVQKAKIQAMSKQYSIPIPQLNLDTLDFPPLGMIPPTMTNTLPTTIGTASTATKHFRGQQPEVPPAPQAPRLEPAQPFPRAPAHVPKSATATNRYYHEHEGPISATPPATYAHENPDSLTAAPRKVDMSYKTTPCRHFTLNRGWCPWGDDCCFIHDPALEWVPPPERGSSGRSTPSSTTLVGGNYKPVHNGTEASAPEPSTAQRSSSSQSAHCWGYIQGLCPHSGDTCKFIHPSNVVPYMKYTPCLMWPRCGYPTQVCPLKHPQVDKLPMHGQPAVAHGTTPPVVPQSQTTTAYADEQLRRLTFPIASMQGAPPSLIIPHDAAYASAVQYHNPMPPSAETFSPPPPRVAVRLSHPSDAGRVSADQLAVFGGPGVRGRRVSIAVQRPDAEFAGGASGEYVRGHGRGRSMQL